MQGKQLLVQLCLKLKLILGAKLVSVKNSKKYYLIIIIFFFIFTVATNIIDLKNEIEAEVIFLPDREFQKSLALDIKASRKEVYCAVYMFKIVEETSELYNSIVSASQRGVNINLIMDSYGGSDFNYDTGHMLATEGVTVLYSSPDRKLHTKVCVIDGTLTYIGSHNYTKGAFALNKEASVKIISQKYAEETLKYLKAIDTI